MLVGHTRNRMMPAWKPIGNVRWSAKSSSKVIITACRCCAHAKFSSSGRPESPTSQVRGGRLIQQNGESLRHGGSLCLHRQPGSHSPEWRQCPRGSALGRYEGSGRSYSRRQISPRILVTMIRVPRIQGLPLQIWGSILIVRSACRLSKIRPRRSTSATSSY